MIPLVAWPFLSLVPAVIFAALFFRRRRTMCLVTSGVWLAYTLYEYLMYARILCSGECNIRVDLLVIHPVLLALSAFTLFQYFVKTRPRTDDAP